MMITNTITKKLLENIIHESFSKFGSVYCSSLLDSLKLLGFSYATFGGISINIEDLKTPNSKKYFIKQANKEIDRISYEWYQGNLSDTERFQTIIDSWNLATESLKNRIIEYYQNFDPTNNLYVMAFSGARGNMSQVRQLVGMRGLMSDQDGKIIDLPIQSNFREGLSSIDYIISSYGARKGIVDTALKTADSGYLTRRLIYIAQDLVIRQKNCGTKNGIIFLIEKNTNIKNLIGRSLISYQNKNFQKKKEKEFVLTPAILASLKKNSPFILNIRSSLTCKSNGSICQYCYGWDLSQNKMISLGEAVGIIAAQSIGEPGTQLTMRTFHTGGIFTGELLNQIIAPFSGKLFFPFSLKTIPYRTPHGRLVLKLQQEISILLIDWSGKTKDIFLDSGSFLYVSNLNFVKKGDLLAEFMNQSLSLGARKLKPIFSNFSGEIRFENLLVRKMFRDKRTIKVNQDDGVLWLSSGKLFILPKESNFFSLTKLSKNKPFASLNLVTPEAGIITFDEKRIILIGKEKKFFIKINSLKFEIQNVITRFHFLLKNYQIVDNYTFLGIFHFFPKHQGKIYVVRKKSSTYKTTFFVISEDDIWKMHHDSVNNFLFFQKKKAMIRSGTLINSTSKTKNSGFFLKKDGLNMIFQKAFPIFLSRGTILNYKQGDFVLEKTIIANLVNYTQQTEDIVQGLPKIEELIEARKPKVKSYLSVRPGILLNSNFLDQTKLDNINRTLEKNVIRCILKKTNRSLTTNFSKKKDEKQTIFFLHSIFLKKEITVFQNRIYKTIIIPSIFKPHLKEKQLKKRKKKFFFSDGTNMLIRHGKPSFSIWILLKQSGEKFVNFQKKAFFSNKKIIKKILDEKFLYHYKNEKLTKIFEITADTEIYQNPKGDLIFYKPNQESFFLEYLTPILEYQIPLTSKIIFEPGNFIDLGEPFTEGMIDIHELLSTFVRYHVILDGTLEGSLKALHKFQLLLVNSIQSIYQSQGVSISSKHIEIIVRQMTGKAVIKDSGDSPLLPGELVRLSLIFQIYQSLNFADTKIEFKLPKFEPLLLSSTNTSLTKDGFLSSAGFQETKRILSKAAIEGSTDWLRGLKECIIIGRIIPAGSTFLNYKNYLDNVYLFKNE